MGRKAEKAPGADAGVETEETGGGGGRAGSVRLGVEQAG